jgi:ribosomal protein L17
MIHPKSSGPAIATTITRPRDYELANTCSHIPTTDPRQEHIRWLIRNYPISEDVAVARLHQEDAVKILFTEIAPAQKDRRGGYTRIVRLGQQQGDASQKAILEWVDLPLAETAVDDTDAADAAKPADVEEGKKEGEAKAEAAK